MSRVDRLIQDQCPDGVKFVTLASVAKTVPGLSGKTKADFHEGNARYVTYKNAFSNLAVDDTASDFVKVEEGERQNSLRLGDVVITGSSENFNEVGMSSVVVREPVEPLYLNSFCFALRFEHPTLLPEFCKYLFRGETLRKQIRKSASGVTRINVSKPRFMKTRIPVPPLEVQREIVRILDKFTQLEAELEVKLEAELEARRVQYEHYRDTQLAFEDSAPRVCIGEVIDDLRTGLNPRQNFKLNQQGAKNLYITVRDLAGFEIRPSKKTDRVDDDGLNRIQARSRLRVGDVLFSGTGTIGRTALVSEEPRDWNIKEGVYALTPRTERILPRFLIHLLHSQSVRARIIGTADGSTVASISMASLRRIPIPLPNLAEQSRLVALLDRFEGMTNSLSIGLPAELAARRKQYEHYRDRLLTFKELAS